MANKILIVDDDLDTLRLVSLMLQREGFQVTTAANGSQGYSKADAEHPDLILLDVMMPDMDGYEVTRRLRENQPTKDIPILMFTAKIQLDDKVTGFEVGADDYLTKPTHPNELIAKIRALLARNSENEPEKAVTSTEKNGHSIGILSARGGLGVTSLALNLAMGLYAKTHMEVILAELTPGQGSIGIELGVSGKSGLTEILQNSPAKITPKIVKKSLIKHKTELQLFLASENPRDVALASQIQNYGPLVKGLASLASFVFMDLGAGLPGHVQEVLPLCASYIVVVEGMPSTIRHTKNLLSELTSLRLNPNAIHVVLNNRQRLETQMQLTQVQEQLGHSISAILSPAPELFQQASTMQMPAVLVQPTNITSQQILKLADIIIKHEKAR